MRLVNHIAMVDKPQTIHSNDYHDIRVSYGQWTAHPHRVNWPN